MPRRLKLAQHLEEVHGSSQGSRVRLDISVAQVLSRVGACPFIRERRYQGGVFSVARYHDLGGKGSFLNGQDRVKNMPFVVMYERLAKCMNVWFEPQVRGIPMY